MDRVQLRVDMNFKKVSYIHIAVGGEEIKTCIGEQVLNSSTINFVNKLLLLIEDTDLLVDIEGTVFRVRTQGASDGSLPLLFEPKRR